jgi:hypothetical protein
MSGTFYASLTPSYWADIVLPSGDSSDDSIALAPPVLL